MSHDSDQLSSEKLRYGAAYGDTAHSGDSVDVVQSAEGSGAAALGELRAELDGIDEVLRAAVRDRIDVCIRVARVKRDFDIPMMQPGRVGIVTDRAREFAAANDMSPDFLEELYRLMIAEACRVEDLIIDAPLDESCPDGER